MAKKEKVTPKFALAQMEVKAGMPARNVESMLRSIAEAKAQGVDVIAFPEMCIGGYLVGDKWEEDAFTRDLMKYNDQILAASEGIAVIFGNVFLDEKMKERGIKGYHPNEDGRLRRFNGVYVAQDGAWVKRKLPKKALPAGVHTKTHLPNYRFFDDKRHFHSTKGHAEDLGLSLRALLQPFELEIRGRKVQVGVGVCEDLWCEDYRAGGRAINPTQMLIDNGAEFIVNISASPWTHGKNGARDRRVKFLKKESGKSFRPFMYVNHTGVQNNGKNFITFDGGSTVYDRQGDPIILAKRPYGEELIVVDDFEQPAVERQDASLIGEKYEALIQGIRHLKDLRGSREDPTFLVGLSGGVDSAVAAALLVDAVGKDKVLTVNMPSKYNSAKTKGAAEHVARALGVRYSVVPIQKMTDTVVEALNASNVDGKGTKLSSLNEENVQAKIRATDVLSTLAGMVGGVFTNNGNKLEIARGYATLYGDVGGAVSILGDLLKPEVFELARHLNRRAGQEVIPEALLPDAFLRFDADQIEPTAELKEAQKDPMFFGYEDALLAALTDFKKHSPEDFARAFAEGTLHRLLAPYMTWYHFESFADLRPTMTQEEYALALMRRWKVDEPKVFLEHLETFARSVNDAVFKRVQAPPIIVTSKSAYGYDIRESMIPWSPTAAYQSLKAEIASRGGYHPKSGGSE